MIPRTIRPIALASLAAASLLLVAACGGGDAAAGDPGATAAGAAPGATTAASIDGAPITDADLDLYERGIVHEATLVEAARARARSAPPAERAAAMQGEHETATMPAAAGHLGVDAARYAAVRTTVHDVLRRLDMVGAIEGPVSVDTTRLDAAARARLADPYAGLPAATVDAIRARLDRLAPAYARYEVLVALAG